jgi:hypothetical protein
MVTGQGEAERGEKMGEAKERRTGGTDDEGKRKCEIQRERRDKTEGRLNG